MQGNCPIPQASKEASMARPASRFIEKLTSRQIQKLTERKDHGVVDLAQIFQTNRTTVSQWLDRWDAERFAGLADKPRPGAPARFSESERTRVLELLKQFPQNPAAVLAGLKQETGTEMSRSTLKQIARKAGLMWKRMRKSVAGKRDQKKSGTPTCTEITEDRGCGDRRTRLVLL
jgi:transposase